MDLTAKIIKIFKMTFIVTNLKLQQIIEMIFYNNANGQNNMNNQYQNNMNNQNNYNNQYQNGFNNQYQNGYNNQYQNSYNNQYQNGFNNQYQNNYNMQSSSDFTGYFDQMDIENNKIISGLSYLGILFFLPLVAAPNSRFGKFHANQSLVLLISSVCVQILSYAFSFFLQHITMEFI